MGKKKVDALVADLFLFGGSVTGRLIQAVIKARQGRVLGTITLIANGDITAGFAHDINWTRDPNDPDTFVLVKFDLDGHNGPTPNFNETTTVTAHGSLNGTVQMIFDNSDYFQVNAFAKDEATLKKPALAISNTFKVDKPIIDDTGLASAAVTILTASTSVVSQYTTNAAEMPSAASAAISPEDDSKREVNRMLIIIASVLGGLVGFIILGIVLYFYWRYSMARREKKLGRTMLIPDVEDGDDQLQPLGRNRVLRALASANPFSSTIDVKSSPNKKLLPNSRPSSPSRLPSTIAADIPSEQLNVDNLAESETSRDLQADRLVELEVQNRVPDMSSTAFQAMAAEVERMKSEIDWLKNQHLVDHFPPEYSSTRGSQ
ncbi:hypothetical protein C8J56DRAFT_1028432 [Mycena floridula]|nr:hypothetical protein C8J56DRAFT_1028432 [Mycena floridula]